MIIHNFHVFGARNRPAEADPELIVNSDAVLSLAVTLEGFKPVAGRNAKVFGSTSNLQLSQLAPSHALNHLKPLDPAPIRECLGIRILERYDHKKIVMRRVINVKREARSMPKIGDSEPLSVSKEAPDWGRPAKPRRTIVISSRVGHLPSRIRLWVELPAGRPGTTCEQVGAASTEFAGACSREHKLLTARCHKPLNLVENGRNALHFIDDDPSAFREGFALPAKAPRVPLQAQALLRAQQVEPRCVGELVANPGRLSGASRVKQKKRTVRSVQGTCKHRQQLS